MRKPLGFLLDLFCAFAAFSNRVFTGKEVVLSAQVCVDQLFRLCISRLTASSSCVGLSPGPSSTFICR